MISYEQFKKLIKYVSYLILLKDYIYVYNYLENYYNNDLYKNEKVIEDDILNINNEIVDINKFNNRLNDIKNRMIQNDPSGKLGMHKKLDNILLKISRESILFGGGGRAATLQLLHPFVAKGIMIHSNLKNGVQQRFYRTFKYMFLILFGTRKDALLAARTVRGLHNKVVGDLDNEAGNNIIYISYIL